MLGWVRSLLPTGRQAKTIAALVESNQRLTAELRGFKAKYDAAQTNDDNRRHWGNADGMSALAANSHGVRRLLRNRSRYEYDNGAYCNGIVRTRADDLVGTGPTLQFLSDDDAVNEQLEELITSWARASCFAEKLHTMDQARNRDGESFAVLVTNPALNHPVKLDLLLIEADRVMAPFGPEFPTGLADALLPNGNVIADGIEYDRLGNVLAYHILRQHPGDPYYYQPYVADRYPAEYVLHWFRKDRPGQVRGVPELTASLPLFPYLRRWMLATLAAAEFAASQAGVLETEGPVDPDTTTASPFSAVEIERNMFTELPAGYKLHQMASDHPNQQFEGFKREVVAEGGRPVRMPVNVVSADSSKHNYSSAKLDHFGYRGGIRVDRHFADINILDRVYAAVFAEAKLLPGLVPAGLDPMALRHAAYWPGWPSMDKDEAKNDTERLNNGTETLQSILAEWGLDWKAVIRQRGKELKFLSENGVPPPPSTGGGAPAASANPGPAPAAQPVAAHADLLLAAMNGHANGRAH